VGGEDGFSLFLDMKSVILTYKKNHEKNDLLKVFTPSTSTTIDLL